MLTQPLMLFEHAIPDDTHTPPGPGFYTLAPASALMY